MNKPMPFLMFQGEAYAAIKYYTTIIKNSKIVYLETYENSDKIKNALFRLNGQEFMAFDSTTKHHFDFTPSFSVFLLCDTIEEVIGLYQEFTREGEILMPLDTYGTNKQFAWINDKYGVSWQLNIV